MWQALGAAMASRPRRPALLAVVAVAAVLYCLLGEPLGVCGAAWVALGGGRPSVAPATTWGGDVDGVTDAAALRAPPGSRQHRGGISAASGLLIVAVAGVAAQVRRGVARRAEGQCSRINTRVELESPKVATKESLKGGDKRVYCRCWQSEKFPLCDGAHVKHNDRAGDNVGPLIVAVEP